MMKLRACLLAALLAAASSPLAAQTTPIDRIAAVVNEDVILQSELDRSITNITAQYAGTSTQLPPANVLARQVMERLVLTRLQVSRAREVGIVVTDQEVEQAVAGIAQQNGFTIEQLTAQLAAEAMSMDDFRRSIHDEIAIQRLKQSFGQSRVHVSEAEVSAALAQATGAGGMQYRLAHILVAVPEGATAEQIATGQQKIDGIKALIDRGEMDFATAAVRYSDSPNALEGGDLGWRPESEIPPAFAQSIKTLAPGHVLGPIRGVSGFQLIRLVETRSAAEAGPAMLSQYLIRHILIRTDDGTTDAAARAKLETLRARLAGGADFAELARDASGDPATRERGGEIGWVDADALGPQLGGVIAGMKDGEVTAPMQLPTGWHIIQRGGMRQAQAGSDEQRSVIRENIGRRKLEDEYNRFLQEMRGEAYVDVRSASVVGEGATESGNGG